MTAITGARIRRETDDGDERGGAVAKNLVIGVDQEKTWRLPDEADIGRVQDALRSAMENGSVAEVTVRLGWDLDATLLVNGKVVPAAAVYEVRPGMG
jgi:hypothetical protein